MRYKSRLDCDDENHDSPVFTGVNDLIIKYLVQKTQGIFLAWQLAFPCMQVATKGGISYIP